MAETAGLAYDRDHDDLTIARQAVASVASGDRTEKLRKLELPTLVIHGTADPMCDPSGGPAMAEAIPGAELHLIEGMGHNFPLPLWEPIVPPSLGSSSEASSDGEGWLTLSCVISSGWQGDPANSHSGRDADGYMLSFADAMPSCKRVASRNERLAAVCPLES